MSESVPEEILYRLYVRDNSSWWKPLADIRTDSHALAVQRAVSQLTPEQFARGIRLEAVEEKNRLTDVQRRWLIEAERQVDSDEFPFVGLECVAEKIGVSVAEGLEAARGLLRMGYVELCVEGSVWMPDAGRAMARSLMGQATG